MGETQTAKRPALDSSAADALLADGQDLLHRRDFEGALDLFQLASGLRPGNVEIEGYIDMVRGQLLRSYRERMNGLATPRLIADRAAITRFNLPADAGFVLSLVDGATNVESLVSLSGMAPFETLRILNGLAGAGIVEVET